MAKKEKVLVAKENLVSEVVVDKKEKEIGIKETLELISMLKEVAYAVGRVFADGSYSRSDLARLLELGAKLDVFMVGFEGSSKALNEMGNLKQDEVIELIGALYECVKRFEDGKKLV